MTADPATLKKTKEIGIPGAAFCVVRVPQSGRLLYGSSDFHVYEIDPAAEKPQPSPLGGEPHGSYVTGLARAGEHVVSGSYDGRLVWWNLDRRERVRDVAAHDRWIRSVVASPDGRTIASVADDMLCKLWNAETGEPVRTLTGHETMTPHHYPSMLYAVTISPDGRYLATGDKVGHVVVWDMADGRSLTTLEAPVMYTWDPKARVHSIGGIRSLAFSSDGTRLAVGGMGKVGNIDHLEGKARVELFDWQAGRRLWELEDDKFKGLVEQLAFAPSGDWLCATGGDNGGFVALYNMADGKPLAQEKAPSHVHAFAAADDFATLATVGHGKIALWELT